MFFSKKAFALAASALVSVSFASLGQDAPGGRGQTVVVGGAIDWVEKSDVAALKEGVIKEIEFQVGRTVKEGEAIGYLHDEIAALTAAKAELAAKNVGEISKAQAQYDLAVTELSRLKNLNKKGAYASPSEVSKALAEVAVADALQLIAQETKKINEADYALAKRALKEHTIVAPFSGVITDRMKNPGESVRSNEAVVRLGRTDKMRFVGWVPLEVAIRIKGNELVDVRPMVEGSDLAIEQQKFRGKVTSVSREVNAVRSTEVQVLAEIENPKNPDQPELELRQGMKAEMTIYLANTAAKVASVKTPR